MVNIRVNKQRIDAIKNNLQLVYFNFCRELGSAHLHMIRFKCFALPNSKVGQCEGDCDREQFTVFSSAI